MGESSLPVTVVYKAVKNTTLLPASAVRQEGEGAYVYVVSRDYGGGLLGSGPVVKVHRQSSAKMIRRGGRIPAPMQSLKN